MTLQLQPIDLVAPGSAGVNFQQSGMLLPPEWSTRADNCVIDESRRVAVRKGYSSLTTTAISPAVNVESIFEYIVGNGTSEIILSYDGGISNDTTDPETNDCSGAVTDTDGRWWFQNFNGKCLGFQEGKKPIVYSGTSFATVSESSGTAPTVNNGVALCAYGRVWAVDSDGQTIKYSGLLDETDWGTASAGQIDMSSIWTGGMDEVTAIAAFNSSLIVFGRRHIIIFDDNLGSEIGFDPVNAVVADVLQGTGCISQWTVQHIGTADIVFLSKNGLQSLGRVIVQKNNPLETVSKYVRDELLADVHEAETDSLLSAVSSCYSPEEGFYLLTFPGINAPRTWCFSVKDAFQDEDGSVVYPATTWDLTARSLCVTDDGRILLGGSAKVFLYGANTDDGTNIEFDFETPWLDLGENLGNRIKLLKRIGSIVFVKSSATIQYQWSIDFDDNPYGQYVKVLQQTSGSEYGIAEYGLSEFASAALLQIIKVPARASGQYYKFRITSDVSGDFALQQIEMFAKIGRVA